MNSPKETHECVLCQKKQTMAALFWHWLDTGYKEPEPCCLNCAHVIGGLVEMQLFDDENISHNKEWMHEMCEAANG